MFSLRAEAVTRWNRGRSVLEVDGRDIVNNDRLKKRPYYDVGRGS